MAAYAALISLMNIMDQIQAHPRHSFSFDSKQMESLRQNVDFLVEFLVDEGSKEAEDLQSRIASAAHEAEDVIESNVVDQIHAGSTLSGETVQLFLVDLQRVIDDMDSIKEMSTKVRALRSFGDELPRQSNFSGPGKSAMVGFDDELIQLMERLTGPQHNRQIIPIVGMGGIGKTTLARNVYEHLHIVQYFDLRLWATVSHEYSSEQILSELFYCLGKSASRIDQALELLHKTLSGRRYLVVLDDMWSVEAWNEIQLYLPDNGNGSCVVITTRLSNMAIGFGFESFVMDFLDKDKSWILFCGQAFGEEGCPTELEEVGKRIVKKCRGLPLSIVVIGGHLRKSSKTKGYWEEVANDIKPLLNSGDEEQCLNILSWSYSYLPVYLKPYFLYMGTFPEDEKIIVSELIKLWVAEGFVRPKKTQILEEVAEGYLIDLIDRNLILACEWNYNGKLHSCNIHDLSRELCLRVAEKEKFFCVLDKDIPRAIHAERCVVIHHPREEGHPQIFDALRSAQLVRSLKWEAPELSFDMRLLRVLNRVDGATDESLDAYFQRVNLRYFNYSGRFSSSALYLPSSISGLWNLQTLKIKNFRQIIVPHEIWDMPQLRHVELQLFCLPDPPLPSNQPYLSVLPNLQTLLTVENFRMTGGICKRIPNIRKLNVWYTDSAKECDTSSYYCPHNLSLFHELEALDLCFSAKLNWRDFALSLTFPSSLTELSLQGCRLHWEDLSIIGSLPHLIGLNLSDNSVVGSEWNPAEVQFLRLKTLAIKFCYDLTCWNADSSHFPVLEKLALFGMWFLDEIPSGIGEIPTLTVMELHWCAESAALSALEILVEQESLGNEGLRVVVKFWSEEHHESFKEMMEAEGLKSNNLQLQ